MIINKRPSNMRMLLIAFLVIGLLLPLSGCTLPNEDDEDNKVTFNMMMTRTAPRDTGTTTVWDATADINKITPTGSIVSWADVSIAVKSVDGSVIIPKTPVKEDTNTYGSGIESWYVDTTGGRDSANGGDTIKVSGLDTDAEGGTILVTYKGNVVANMNLPIDFS